MDTEPKSRFDGPHLPVARRKRLRQIMGEVDHTIDELLRAEVAFTNQPSAENAERIGVLSEMAWGLLFPYRRQVLQMNAALLTRFRDAVERLQSFLHEHVDVKASHQTLMVDLTDRQLMLNALLGANGESRLRELLVTTRTAVAEDRH